MKWNAFLSALWPQFCKHCEKKSNDAPYFLCEPCFKNLESYKHDSMVSTSNEPFPIYALWRYQNELKSIFSAAKFENLNSILPVLFKGLDNFFSKIDFKNTSIIKIPSQYNLVHSLGHAFKRNPDCKIYEPFVKRKNQFTKRFNRDERLSNEETLSIDKKVEIPQATNIILIDDLVTSGSTLRRAKYLLEENYSVGTISGFTIAFSEQSR